MGRHYKAALAVRQHCYPGPNHCEGVAVNNSTPTIKHSCKTHGRSDGYEKIRKDGYTYWACRQCQRESGERYREKHRKPNIVRLCTLSECKNKHVARGYCAKHYQRWYFHGDPNYLLREPVRYTLEESVTREGGCLIWLGTKDEDGYGRIQVDGKTYSVHRYSWSQVNGPIPHGMYIDHICHNPSCVDPDHLRPVTPGQNSSNRKGSAVTSKTGVRNVYQNPSGRYRVSIRKNGQPLQFGVFDTLEEAAKVAKVKRREVFGEYSGKG